MGRQAPGAAAAHREPRGAGRCASARSLSRPKPRDGGQIAHAGHNLHGQVQTFVARALG